ncbi:MAG: histidinol-phosphate transaminase [Pseudomonadota bacterium]
MAAPRPNPWLDALSPYVPGRHQAGGHVQPVRLASNESPLGASPQAIAAARAAAATMHRYADGAATRLREALAAHHGLDAAHIICGTGSDEILQLVAQAYAAPGDEVIHSAYGFMVYPIAARRCGARPIAVAETDYRADVDAILGALSDRTRVVYLANPNNPTGTYMSAAEINRLHAGLPEHVVLVLDAAYAEYMDADDYEPGLALARRSPNVLMTRTFSKIYGLAAERVGWATGAPALITALNKIRGPFNVTGAGQAAALAALGDQGWIARTKAHNDEWRPWLAGEIAALGLRVIPSAANFLLVEFPQTPGRTAAEADAYLTARGFLLRHLANMGLGHCLRLTVGLEADNRSVVAALAGFMNP